MYCNIMYAMVFDAWNLSFFKVITTGVSAQEKKAHSKHSN